MSAEYDNNGYNSDFKRNSNPENTDEMEHAQDGDDASSKLNEKAGEYMRELLSEKIKLHTAKFPISTRLIDQEVTKVQASGRVPLRDSKYVDVYREKPVKVVVKVLVPIKEHPKFNFVGKLLGPKGNTMKQLQEDTMCKMSVLGKGSMRDRQKEEELRNSLDPKYSHLTDELHVEISALAPPAEAHARIAYALAEVKKYLLPDSGDMMRPPMPMREMIDRGPPRPVGPPSRPGPPPRMAPPMPPRIPGKSKVISILERARTAMETSPYSYDDPYASVSEPPVRPTRSAPQDYDYYERERYYEEDYYKEAPPREFKPSREVGTRRSAPAQRHAPRHAPYARPQQKTMGSKKRQQ